MEEKTGGGSAVVLGFVCHGRQGWLKTSFICVLDTGISIHPSRWETSPKIIGLFLQSHFEMMNMSKSKTWFISIRD